MPDDPHVITLEDAKPMTTAYRESDCYVQYARRKAVAFSIEAINRLTAQAGVAGIRCYFAHDSTDKLTLVLCAYDSDGNDLLTELAEMALPCPQYCSRDNELNSQA